MTCFTAENDLSKVMGINRITLKAANGESYEQEVEEI